MNSVKYKCSSEKSGQSVVKKGHSSKRFLKYHVERNYFKGINMNASRKGYQKLENPKELEPIYITFSPPAEFIEMADIVVSIGALINDGVTVVQEVSNNVIEYSTPMFRATAIVNMPYLPKGTDIQIGWIQVCTEGINPIFHGDKFIYSWELPEIVSGKYSMFTDSNIYSMPWYDVVGGVTTKKGPSPPSTAVIVLDDSPSGVTSWFGPLAGRSSKPTLTYIYRKQHFLTYLVIKNMKEKTYEIIKCISWNCEVAIEINPQKKLGERVVFVGPCTSQIPTFLSKEKTPPLEENIFQPFVANRCMILTIRSKNQKSKIGKKPCESSVNLETYLNETDSFTTDLFKVTQRNFLLNCKRKTD